MSKVFLATDTIINDVHIPQEFFNEDRAGYRLEDREEFIDCLIKWIAEINPWRDKHKQADKILMMQDLKYLICLEDKYIFSSIYTNEYICQSDNSAKFEETCEVILVEYEAYKKEIAKPKGETPCI